jgi:DDE superfamily endonuclease
MWCIGELTKKYILRMEDILDLYDEKYDPKRPVVCLDEKPVVLREDSRPSIPARPGRPLKRDYEYIRHGKVNVFCSVEPKAGKHFAKATPNRSGPQFAMMLSDIARRYPKAKKIHLVMDNLSTHTKKMLIDHFGKERGKRLWRRFKVHYTPTHGSWLNQAETEIGIFIGQYVGKSRVPNLTVLKRKVAAWNEEANAKRILFNWCFTKAKARKTMGYKKV